MHEDELTTINIEEDDDSFLPDGWQEGDDFFADPSTWSGASQKSGQTTESQSETESTEVDTVTEEAPTTGETDETDGQSAEQEGDDQSGQTEEPTKRSRILKLKVNHEEQEVDIENMSDDELVAALQKSRAFDAMKDDQAKARYREVYREQLEAGMTEAAARMIASNEVGGKTYALEDPADAPQQAEPVVVPTPAKPARDFVEEVNQLKALYPDFKEMPDEVAKAVSGGTNLLTAYLAYREKQNSKAAASLRKENEVLRQNAASAAKAPVTGVTGGGATDTKPQNPMLAAFEADDW